MASGLVSSLGTQVVLDQIQEVAIADGGGFIGGGAMPMSAFLAPDSVGFRTDCSAGWAGYRYLRVTVVGTSYQSCGPHLIPKFKPSHRGQYAVTLDRLGATIRESVRLSYDQPTSYVSGNRQTVTADYSCALSAAGVRQIVLRRRTKTRSRATLTMC
jgi:hypothetical protein